jgi:putative thioredoxin
MNSNNESILEITENEFQEKVINDSNEKLILVDFWAPWCGPCKQLTPVLEKIINKSENKVTLIKINIDENKQIASQLKIQSIPAVFAFKNGQPVDAFQGVIPENKIIEFIEKNLNEKLTKDHSDFYELIIKLIKESNFTEAISSLEGFIAENPNEFKGVALYLDCLGNLEKYGDAKKLYESLDENSLKNKDIQSVYKKLILKEKNSQGPTIDELIAAHKKKPKEIKNLLALADKYFAENLFDEAFNLLLSNYDLNKEAIKKKILKFFEMLGNEDVFTIQYRKKLSSIIFS